MAGPVLDGGIQVTFIWSKPPTPTGRLIWLGGSFTLVIWMVTVAFADPPWPSVTDTLSWKVLLVSKSRVASVENWPEAVSKAKEGASSPDME